MKTASNITDNKHPLIQLADFLLIYSILAQILFNIIRPHLTVVPGYFPRAAIQMAPGLAALAIYIIFFGLEGIYRNKLIFVSAWIVATILLAASLRTIGTNPTRDSIVHFFSDCLFGFMLSSFACFEMSRAKRFVRMWAPFIILFIVYFSLTYLTIGRGFYGLRRFGLHAPENSARIGALLFFFSIVLFHYYFIASNTAMKWTTALLGFVCCLLGLSTASRSALVSNLFIIICYAVFFLYIKGKKSSMQIFVAAGAVFIALILVTMIVPGRLKSEGIFKTTSQIIHYLANKDRVDYREVNRLSIWKNAIEQFKKSPLTGIGHRHSYFRTMYVKKKNIETKKIISHPHSIFLQFLVETGLIGFSTFILFLVLILKRARGMIKKIPSIHDKLTFFFFPAAFAFFIVFASANFSIHENYILWYFAGIISGFKSADGPGADSPC